MPDALKVFAEIGGFAVTASRAELADRIARLADAGVAGVSLPDHLFYTVGGVTPGCDPMTVLGAIAGMDDRLELRTIVMNTAWIHPALLLRSFAQLAVLAGGERVTAGLGAGWSGDEFAAVGMAMPPFRERMDRLEEVLALARTLFDTGVASVEGRHVVTRGLPLAPVPAVPPRLLVGGGSDRVLRMAGRYADVIDLHGDPRHGRVVGASMAEEVRGDTRRRALTTVDELGERIALVREAASAAGRPPVEVSTQILFAVYGTPAQVRAEEERLCETWAKMPYRPLGRSPYLLTGGPAEMAEALAERRALYGLSQLSLTEGVDPVRFCREVLPLLG